ncbi:dnaJ homolog subfamily C member 21 [Tenebrio molitor]|jgi:DnaJ family protein A protein 5|uniref:dnaJ homolog subfamily C member 21 n=1 Tax=Tenebrio molitor TaxID=7067 RepID=UPI003624993B
MKCHYEILDVSRDADAAEIKSAYRKYALKWHPDKNLTNTEFAKEQFQLVQQAYEVLSDPQERAWYDKHREQILRGSDSEFQDSSLDVFQYFTTTCFKGYGDDEKGFYTVYRNVFDQIIKEDLEFIDDKEEFCEIPRFGDSKSDYDEVVGPFYSYWSSYCTKKSYVWRDPYDIKETRDRRVLKLIEKENKKVRQKAKKERNEEVRNLVAFVRKRDKRVQEHTKLLEARILENRQKQEKLSKQRRLERKRELNESGAQAEWTKFDNVKSELEEIEKKLAEEFGEEFSNSEDDDDDEDISDLYCVACNKIFKTPKALENHESSKKHKENVERLKEIMLEEEEEEITDDEVEAAAEEDVDDISQTDDLSGTSEESEDSVEQLKKQKKKNKKAKNIMTINNEEEISCEVDMTKVEDSDDNFDFELTKKQKKKNAKKQNKSKVTTENKNEENEVTVEKIMKNGRKKQNKKEKQCTNIEEIDTDHCCVTCLAKFSSKNKLFQHLKQTRHGAYLPNKNVKVRKNGREE